MYDPLSLLHPQPWPAGAPLDAAACAAAFDAVEPLTVGIEVELMLVDGATFELAPEVARVLTGLDARMFKPELRPAQVELVSSVCRSVHDATAELAAARTTLVEAIAPDLRLIGAGTHPFSTNWGEITNGDRYRRIADEYTWAAVRSVACGLHVHVAVGGADRSLAVYNALRSYLPEIGALAANSPYSEGRDTGMASIRGKLNEAFPRSGVPPAFATWDDMTGFIAWARRGGLFPDASHFWWDLRPHPEYGTIELRVADAQTRVEDTAGVAAFFHALVAWLSDRSDASDGVRVHDAYRINENLWRVLRYGVRGWIVDLDTGDAVPTRERLRALMSELEPVAERIGCAEELDHARTLLAGNGAERQRYVAERRGMTELARWLADETERSARRVLAA